MLGSINNVQTDLVTHNSGKPVTDFEKSTDIIEDEILSFASNNYGDLITSLGLDAANMSAMDLAEALSSNENSDIANEVNELQNSLAQATFDLAQSFYTDENIQNADFEDDREAAIGFFSAFNTDGDKATELQSFVLDSISDFNTPEEETEEVYNQTTNNELTSENSTKSPFDTLFDIKTTTKELSKDDGDNYDYSTMTSASMGKMSEETEEFLKSNEEFKNYGL